MTDPELVGIDLWSPEQELFAAIRANAALVVSGGTVSHVHGQAVALGDSASRVAADGVSFEVQLSALAARPATVPGIHRSVQLCKVEGTVTAGGRSKPLHGLALRARSPADPVGAGRRRFVTAANADGSLVSLVAVRPDAATPHGDELVVGSVVDPQSENGAMPFEEVRLSTIYGPDGLPRSAGAELYRPGDELPARLSGQSIAGAALELDGTALAISFFRWTLLGRPAWGTYEQEPAR